MRFRPIRKPPVTHPALVRGVLVLAWSALAVTAFARCGEAEQGQPAEAAPRRTIANPFSGAPDELPVMVNARLPFRYPAALYAQRIQGNVTLRLFVDSLGSVVPDSMRVEESSGHIALDSAALLGARDLQFRPAKRRGSAIAVSLLYPVYFRHPEADPLPGDTLLPKP